VDNIVLFAEMIINAGFNDFPRSEDSNGYVGGVCRESGECPYKKEVGKLCKLGVMGHRDVAQTRIVAHYKLLESERMGHDVGWNGAWDPWVRNGIAADFDEVFNPGISIDELIAKLFDRKAG
tara:strand:+ start:822 stop:1187 length:366 start_codon:yes stop_codon:yes gene_type:complete